MDDSKIICEVTCLKLKALYEQIQS
jgi:hypothetical protein